MKTKTILLLSFILLKFVLQYQLIGPDYDLHRDEFLHLDQAKHPAWGFESVPPFTSWISWIILQLGNSVFWVKFFPALFGALTLVVVWKAAEALGGGLFALVLSAVAVTLSVILRINILYQPNSYDILSWTFFYFSLLRYIGTKNDRWIWLAALSFGLGFLNKYNIAFLLLGLFPALLLTEHRKIFASRNFYLALSAAVIIVAPNLVWQYQHDFPVAHHMKTLSETQLVHVDRWNFVKEQILYFSGSLFILIAAFISFFRYGPFRKYRVFCWSFIITMSLFLFFKAKAYYAIGLYPVLLAFGAVYLEKLLSHGWKTYLRPVAILIPVLLFLPLLKAAFPIVSPAAIRENAAFYKALGLLRWEDGEDHLLPQDFADMLGWRELAEKVDKAYSQSSDKSKTLVLCDNYGQAGAINYYSKYRNIGAVALSSDYIDWFPLRTMEIKNVILVQDATDTDKTREKEKPLFGTVVRVGAIENPYARESGTAIYLLSDAKTSINRILEEDIKEEKRE